MWQMFKKLFIRKNKNARIKSVKYCPKRNAFAIDSTINREYYLYLCRKESIQIYPANAIMIYLWNAQ